MPELLWEEIRVEVRRRLTDLPDAEVTALIEAVLKEEAPYALLDCMLRALARPVDRSGTFRRRLQRLKRDFRAHGRGGHLGGWYKRLHGVSTAVRGLAIASGLNRLKLPLPALIKAIREVFRSSHSNDPAKPRDP